MDLEMENDVTLGVLIFGQVALVGWYCSLSNDTRCRDNMSFIGRHN